MTAIEDEQSTKEKRESPHRIDIHMSVRRHRLFSAEAGGEFLRIAETRLRRVSLSSYI